MYKRIVLLFLTITSFGALPMITQGVAVTQEATIHDSHVLPMLSSYNPTFNQMGSNSRDSIPLGNGKMAANVWVEKNGDLVIYLSRADSYSEATRLLKIGRVRISAAYENGSNVFNSASPFEQKLILEEGTMYITVGQGPRKTTFKLWIDRNADVFEIETSSSEAVKLQIRNDLWRTKELVLNKNNSRSFIGVHENIKNDPPRESPDILWGNLKSNRIGWYHRNEYSRYIKMVKHQKMDPKIPDYYAKYPDPYLHNTFGALIEGENLTATDLKTLTSIKAKRTHHFQIYTHCAKTPNVQDWRAQIIALRNGIQHQKLQQRWGTHKNWWKNFWLRSWLFITGDKQARAVTQGYLFQRYQVACMANTKDPIHFNGGLFTMCLNPAQGDDYRDWGSMYWHQNTRHVYWPMLQAGDFDFMFAYFNMYLNALPLRKEICKAFFGKNGAYYPEQMYLYGADGTRNKLQWALSHHADWTTYHWQNGFEAMMMMFDYYEKTDDAQMISKYLVPIGQELIRFYYEMYFQKETGKLKIYPSNALEQFWNCTNPTDHLAGLYAILPRLLALEGKAACVTPTLVAEWKRCYAALPPIHEKEDGSAYLPSYDKIRHGMNFENPELYTVFPYELATIDSTPDQLQKGIQTYRNRQFRYDRSRTYCGCWHQDGSQAAMLGIAKDAKENATYSLTAKDSRCRFPGFWKKGHDEVPDYDNGGQGSVTLQRMAMQSYGDRIYLLPAWPKEWNVDFCLHADHRVRVHVTYDGNQVRKLEIEKPTDVKNPQIKMTLPQDLKNKK